MPFKAYYKVTDTCNLKCRFCNIHKDDYRWTGSKALDTVGVLAVLDHLAEAGCSTVQLTGGEPTQREDILTLVNHVQRNLRFCILTTNGTLLDDGLLEGLVDAELDLLWLSIDGIGEFHDQVRQVTGTWQKVEHALLQLQELKRRRGVHKPSVYISVVVGQNSAAQIPLLGDLAIRCGVRELELTLQHEFVPSVYPEQRMALDQTAQLLNNPNWYTGIHIQDQVGTATPSPELSEVLQETKRRCNRAGVYVWTDPRLHRVFGPRTANRCMELWGRININPFGDVHACGFMDGMLMGNLVDQTVEEVWNGQAFRNIRRTFLDGIPFCRLCPNARTTLRDVLVSPTVMERVFVPRALRDMSQRLYNSLRS